MVKLAGATVIEPCRTNGYRLTAKDLEAAATPATRGVVNTPSNPTGAVMDPPRSSGAARRFPRLGRAVRRVLRPLVYEGRHLSAASLVRQFPTRSSFRARSRTYAMTGWRIGYPIGPKPLMDVVSRVVSTRSRTSARSQRPLAARTDADSEAEIHDDLEYARRRSTSCLRSTRCRV
jgi:aspartate/methionine/tyrosine aminotransferase